MDHSPVTEHLDRIGEQLRAGRGALLHAVELRLDELRRSGTDSAPSHGNGLGERPSPGSLPAAPPDVEPHPLARTNGASDHQLAPPPAPPDPDLVPAAAQAGEAGNVQAAPDDQRPVEAPAPSVRMPTGGPAMPASVPLAPAAAHVPRPVWVSNVIAAMLALAVLLIALGVLSFY
jgi:hypothetical protein